MGYGGKERGSSEEDEYTDEEEGDEGSDKASGGASP